MRSRSSFIAKSVVLTLAVLVSPCLFAGPPSGEYRYATPFESHLSSVPWAQALFSNFDGDNHVDEAELSSYGSFKRIHIRLGKSIWKSLAFDSGVSDRGGLISGDVDRDGDIDLIWFSQSNPTRYVMWFGDGRGGFRRSRGLAAYFERVYSLVEDEFGLRMTRHGTSDDLTAAMFASGFGGLTPVPCRTPAVSSETFVSTSDVQSIDTQFLSAVRKRGPPLGSHL